MILRIRKSHTLGMSFVAVGLVVSFVVHDVELTHQHPFAPNAHSGHEQGGHHPERADAAVSVYTHSDRKEFLALLLLIAAIPVAQLILAFTLVVTRRHLSSANGTTQYDYHRLLFRRGILNSKRY